MNGPGILQSLRDYTYKVWHCAMPLPIEIFQYIIIIRERDNKNSKHAEHIGSSFSDVVTRLRVFVFVSSTTGFIVCLFVCFINESVIHFLLCQIFTSQSADFYFLLWQVLSIIFRSFVIFHCVRNISALAGSTNTQDCIYRFLHFIATLFVHPFSSFWSFKDLLL